MNKSKKIIVAVMIVAMLLMAIGYAALSNVTLTIGGTAAAVADDNNFKVWFSGKSTPSGEGASASVTENSRTATVTISDLMVVDEEKYVILEIENESTDIDATSVSVTASDNEFGSTEFIEINAVMCDEDGVALDETPSLNVNQKTYVKVSAKLTQTITSAKSATITAEVVAVPEELN